MPHLHIKIVQNKFEKYKIIDYCYFDYKTQEIHNEKQK